MKLPINFENLLKAGTIEDERIEYKSGWNPEPILKTICAFANDFRDLGGGYIVIGIEAQDGIPSLPPKGVSSKEIDKMQRELLNISKLIEPSYSPIAVPAQYQDKAMLVIYCPGGNYRPYKCPVNLKQKSNKVYFIRQQSSTVKASHKIELELIQLNQRVPFDDLMNMRATINDLELGLIRSFLGKVKSDLFESSATMPFIELLKRMNLVERTQETYYPKNVALMFFNPNPHQYFPQTQIDVAYFPDGLGSDNFTEKIFKGPIDQMLIHALRHIDSNFIFECVQKEPNKPEANRFYNYPYQAIEEALCNAVYHRSYQIREPVEVRILPDRITIQSFPGPDHSASQQQIDGLNFISRRYRNRRIGEYLKELKLTEGRGTGIPKIKRVCTENGSPLPIIHTDQQRSFFVFELLVHQKYRGRIDHVKKQESDQVQNTTGKELSRISRFLSDQVSDQVSDQMQKLLLLLKDEPLSRKEIMERLNLVHAHSFREFYLLPSINAGYVIMTIPDKPRSIYQKYRISTLGLQKLSRFPNSDSNQSKKS